MKNILPDDLILLMTLYLDDHELTTFLLTINSSSPEGAFEWEAYRRRALDRKILLPGEIFSPTRFCQTARERYSLLQRRRKYEAADRENDEKCPFLPLAKSYVKMWNGIRKENEKEKKEKRLDDLPTLILAEDVDLIEEVVKGGFISLKTIFVASYGMPSIIFESLLKEFTHDRLLLRALISRYHNGTYDHLLSILTQVPHFANLTFVNLTDTEAAVRLFINRHYDYDMIESFARLGIETPDELCNISIINARHLAQIIRLRGIKLDEFDWSTPLSWLRTDQLVKIKNRCGVDKILQRRFDCPTALRHSSLNVLTMKQMNGFDDQERRWINMKNPPDKLPEDCFVHDSLIEIAHIMKRYKHFTPPHIAYPLYLQDEKTTSERSDRRERSDRDEKVICIDPTKENWKIILSCFNISRIYVGDYPDLASQSLLNEMKIPFLFTPQHPRNIFWQAFRQDEVKKLVRSMEEIDLFITGCGYLSMRGKMRIGVGVAKIGPNFLRYLIKNHAIFPSLRIVDLARRKIACDPEKGIEIVRYLVDHDLINEIDDLLTPYSLRQLLY